MTDPFPPNAPGPNYTAQWSPAPQTYSTTPVTTYTTKPPVSPTPTTPPGTPGQQTVPVTTTPVVTPTELPQTGPGATPWLLLGLGLLLVGALLLVTLPWRRTR